MAETIIIRERFPFLEERLYPDGWRAFVQDTVSKNHIESSVEIISLNNMTEPAEVNIISINDITSAIMVDLVGINSFEITKEFVSVNNLPEPSVNSVISVNTITTDHIINLIGVNDIVEYEGPYEPEIIGMNRILGDTSFTDFSHTTSIILDSDTDITDYVTNWQIQIDEKSYVNVFSLTFAGNSFFSQCNPLNNISEERIKITIDGVEHNFLLEKRQASSTPEDKSFGIWGRSKICLLDIPYADPVNDKRVIEDSVTGIWYSPDDSTYVPRIWQTDDRLASEIISDVIGSNFTLVMEITDFLVKKDSFVVSNETPIEIVNRLAKVVGAHVRTDINNNVIVRYWNFSTTGTPVESYTDLDDLFMVDESLEFPQGYNKVLIRGPRDSLTDQSIGLIIRLDDDLNNGKTTFRFGDDVWFRVYRSPFDVTYNTTTSLGSIYQINTDVIDNISRENSSFSGKTMQTSLPIWNIVSIEQYDCSVLPVADYEFQEGYRLVTSETEAEDEPVLVSYTSKYDLFRLIVDQPCDPFIFDESIARLVVEQTT